MWECRITSCLSLGKPGLASGFGSDLLVSKTTAPLCLLRCIQGLPLPPAWLGPNMGLSLRSKATAELSYWLIFTHLPGMGSNTSPSRIIKPRSTGPQICGKFSGTCEHGVSILSLDPCGSSVLLTLVPSSPMIE